MISLNSNELKIVLKNDWKNIFATQFVTVNGRPNDTLPVPSRHTLHILSATFKRQRREILFKKYPLLSKIYQSELDMLDILYKLDHFTHIANLN